MNRDGGAVLHFRKVVTRVGALALLVSAGLSHATDAETVVSIGYENGGERLLRVVFTDGSTHSMDANQGVSARLGALFYHTADLTWQTQATFGMQYNHINATNGSAELISYPLEGIFFYNANLIRVGVGATYQINPHMRSTGVVSAYSADFNNAIGWIAQIGFRPKKKQGLSVDLRYTAIRFSGTEVDAGTSRPVSGVDGSSVGAYLTAIF